MREAASRLLLRMGGMMSKCGMEEMNGNVVLVDTILVLWVGA
jgi:hypothetical protein